MKTKFLIATIFLAITLPGYSQAIFIKPKTESLADFISSFTDTLSLAHIIINVPVHDRRGIIYIIPVYDTISPKDNSSEGLYNNFIVVYSLISEDSVTFHCIIIDTLRFDSNANEELEIKTVFFANCNEQKENELFITISAFYNRHAQAGNIYKTFVYDFPTSNNMVWKKEEKISRLFDDYDIGEITDGSSESKPKNNTHIVKYNSAANIKKKLKELGY